MSAHERVDAAVEPFGFESHEDLAFAIKALRMRLLCDDLGEGLDPESEQYHLLALAALDQAQRYAMLAEYKMRQSRAR